MNTSRKGPRMAVLTLLLTGGLAVGLVQTSHADATAAGPTMQSSSPSASPIVKIGQAMIQERQTFPDGTVHTETYFNAVSAASAKAVKAALPVKTAKV